VGLMNVEKNDLCVNLLVSCEKWSIPGLYGCFPSLSYFIKALKLINSEKLLEFRSLTHMNMGGLLLQMGEFLFLNFF